VPSAEDERSLLLRGGKQAQAAVTQFRQAFITQDDFRWLRSEGRVNAVRLPLGYWCLEEHAKGTAFLPTAAFVDAVFEWAEAHDIKVLLELHGASGSQNGEHHSGESGDCPRWLRLRHRRLNLAVLEAWARRWGRRGAFLGLGLGNEASEPQPTFWERVGASARSCCGCRQQGYWEKVAHFYAQAAERCRPHMRAGSPLIIDTCWDMGRWASGRLRRLPGPVWLDYHHYQCHGSDSDPGSVSEHCEAEPLREAFEEAGAGAGGGPGRHPLVLGEFSLALKPEAEGYHEADWQPRFFEQQAGIASRLSVGWFFWTYKMARKGWPHWSYRESVERGWIVPSAG